MDAASFTLAFDVRDYECDIEGIVNNAVYQQYLEHARHQFLKSRGLDFSHLSARGIHLVVVRAELDYKSPLRSGETFVVGLVFQVRSPVRCQFVQEIRRTPGDDLVLTATIECAAMDARGKPMRLPALLEALNRTA